MMASQRSPLMAKPTTAKTAHTTSKITRTVHMSLTLRASTRDRYAYSGELSRSLNTHAVTIAAWVRAGSMRAS